MSITESGLSFSMSPMAILFTQLGGSDERPLGDDHLSSNSPDTSNAGTYPASNDPTSDGIDEAVSSNSFNEYDSSDVYKNQGTKGRLRVELRHKFAREDERIVPMHSNKVNSASDPELPGGKLLGTEDQSASVESTGSELDLNQICASKGKMELSKFQNLFCLSPKETSMCSCEKCNTGADPNVGPKVLNSLSNPTDAQLFTSPSYLPFNANNVTDATNNARNVFSRLGPKAYPRKIRTIIIDKTPDIESGETEALPDQFVLQSATDSPELSQRFCESFQTGNFALPEIANLDNVALSANSLIPEESAHSVPFISNDPAEKIETTNNAQNVMSRLGPKLQGNSPDMESDEAEASPDVFEPHNARDSPGPSQRAQTVSSDSIGIASLDLPANPHNSEFSSSLRVHVPYISNDPEENHDNSDPNWNYLHSLNTDDERYRVVRQRWKSVVIPNPNQNLTFQNYRNRWEVNGKTNVNIDTPVNNKRKRSLSDSTDMVGPVAKRICRTSTNTCTNLFQIKMEHARENYRRKNERQQSCFDEQAQRYIVDPYSSWPNRLVHDRLEIITREQASIQFAELENQHHKSIRKNEIDYNCEVNNLKASLVEIIAFHGFYYGLKNSSNISRDANVLSKQQEIEIQQQDDMYSEYDTFYK